MARRDSILHKPKDTRGALRRMLAFLGPFKWLILLVALLCVASNLLALWGPDLAGHAINEAAAGPGKVDFEGVWYYASRMLLCYLFFLPAHRFHPLYHDERVQAGGQAHAAGGVR